MKKFLILFGLWISLLLSACSDNALTKEQQIKQYIDSGVQAAENRELGELTNLLHDNYRDLKGMNKQQLTQLIRAYFFRHKNIYLFTKMGEMRFPTEQEAHVTLFVAMAGSVISDASLLSSLRAKMYKFELQLIKDDDWLLQEARWQPATVEDMR